MNQSGLFRSMDLPMCQQGLMGTHSCRGISIGLVSPNISPVTLVHDFYPQDGENRENNEWGPSTRRH